MCSGESQPGDFAIPGPIPEGKSKANALHACTGPGAQRSWKDKRQCYDIVTSYVCLAWAVGWHRELGFITSPASFLREQPAKYKNKACLINIKRRMTKGGGMGPALAARRAPKITSLLLRRDVPPKPTSCANNWIQP